MEEKCPKCGSPVVLVVNGDQFLPPEPTRES